MWPQLSFLRVLNLQSKRMVHRISNTELIKDLSKLVSDHNLTTNPNDLQAHGKDEGHFSADPQVVVYPQNRDEVSVIMEYCNKKKIPVIPFGSGSGLEGGVCAVQGGVCMDMQSFKKIVRVSDEDSDCTVEAAVTWRALNFFLRDRGLWFPVDPGADATLGGMCSTSASGTNAVRYGTMRENVLNLEVVLADGRIIQTAGHQGRARKTSAGYNLTNLFVGSEGTLGIITSATLRLHPIPEKQASALIQFGTTQEAIESVVEMLQNAVPVARVEFMDEKTVEVCNSYSKTNLGNKPTLLLDFHGSDASIKEQVETIEVICTENGGSAFEWAQDPEARNRLWKTRHSVYYATCAQKADTKCYTTDVCVPISKLPEVLTWAKDTIQSRGLFGTVVGHVGDGNFHCMLLFDPKSEESQTKCHHFARDLAMKAIQLDGTCTGEHGIGLGKKELLLAEHGDDCVALMKTIKTAVDPNNILNPGKIFN